MPADQELSSILNRRQQINDALDEGKEVAPQFKNVKKNIFSEFHEFSRREIKEYEKTFNSIFNTFRTEPVRDTGSGTWPAERSPYVIRAREHGRLNGARMPYVAIYLMLLNGVCRMYYVPRVFQHGF
ncbi:hypothetical protein C0J52_01662 [Blattella germanica]|nr:hypothetical protein C0J52_01662 [Blattella germanica]